MRIMHIDTGHPNRQQILDLAARAGVDPRTAERALREGIDSIRNGRVRESLRIAMTQTRVPGSETT
jgi:hypothetical protein